jgi:glycosyltransferase involved in cell wall biosynthesis
MMIELATYLAFIGAFLWWMIVLVPWRPWSTQEALESTHHGNVSLKEITALIPARNEGQLIGQTLDALDVQRHDLQIIVIDDQSDDDTAEQTNKWGATILSGTSPPIGWSGKLWALEQGLGKISTTYTLLLDADIALAPGTGVTLLKKESARREFSASILNGAPSSPFC